MKLRQLPDMLYNGLNMHKLTKDFLTFSKAHLCFIIAINIQAVFVNILLMRQAGGTETTIYYNMISYIVSGVMMAVAGALSKRMDIRKLAFIGIGFNIIAYGLFLIFINNIVVIFVPIAVLLGTGGGFFWFVYFKALSAYAQDENRDASLAFLGIFGSIIALAVPAVSGVVIDLFVDLTGYTIMFFCAFITAGVSLYLYTRLPKVTPTKEKTAYLHCLKESFVHPVYRFITLSIITRSIRDGIFNFFLNVLLFQYVPSEAVIGFNALWMGFVSIFSQYCAGKILRPNNRVKVMAIAVSSLLGGALLLYLGLNAFSILLLCTVNAFFIVLFMNPACSVDFVALQAMPDGHSHADEYLGMSEGMRAIGRMIGLFFLLALPQTDFGYVTALVGITVVQYITVLASKRAVTLTTKPQEDE